MADLNIIFQIRYIPGVFDDVTLFLVREDPEGLVLGVFTDNPSINYCVKSMKNEIKCCKNI